MAMMTMSMAKAKEVKHTVIFWTLFDAGRDRSTGCPSINPSFVLDKLMALLSEIPTPPKRSDGDDIVSSFRVLELGNLLN